MRLFACAVSIAAASERGCAFSPPQRIGSPAASSAKRSSVPALRPGSRRLHKEETASSPVSTSVSSLLTDFVDPAYQEQVTQSLLVNCGSAALLTAAKQDVLTPGGLFHSWMLGTAMWACLGWPGWVSGTFYLIGGSIVTKIRKAEKERQGIAEKRGGRREPSQVWGSAAASTVCAMLAVVFANDDRLRGIFQLGAVAGFATKLSDTCASEIGKAFGKNTFLSTTLEPVPPGTEGAVSLEGTLAGVAGSLAQALVGTATGLIQPSDIPLCMGAAFVANFFESALGASVQDKIPWLNNELVNLFNTSIGALLAVGIAWTLNPAGPLASA
uniref:DUF92 domain-containing protein n=1 Tax=Chromera velia CCMP2878 TaxID=1169474 RepID=A0A0G4F4Y3_9ALVE|mmetsp:Transcript_14490/g.29168  ORF Transcript_14490/g.29168 Transcript_14490/m.29168 type:complete len:328 (+) Transcript_14490:114-1097(+)|eukprot:Cvel_15094.t1-p1 / transcript=Cvel_15094.t1 / gene=Cvel_15094 / organism=Chromera_velia_CCMP2878 / gene_product=Uncharacterized membrane protein sll0875, putative / transcript_product=Uncharacterized membrane protein sll0875, putative / location=Cvel_scaffold1101:25285-28731(-) / protein_length=327 / sequence_SO=supercontig / SO=protein_coding / is_pseudo=false